MSEGLIQNLFCQAGLRPELHGPLSDGPGYRTSNTYRFERAPSFVIVSTFDFSETRPSLFDSHSFLLSNQKTDPVLELLDVPNL